MKEIVLSNGMVTLVDDVDYEKLKDINWHYKPSRYTGYAYMNIKNADGKKTTRKMHTVIMNTPAGFQIDHKDRDGLNNQRDNLRVATYGQNQANIGKQTRLTSSRFKGVGWDAHRQKWNAHIKVDQVMKNLGRFSTEEAAARAYNEAARVAFGEFASLNDISGST
jgi:predicted RNA methylase